MPAGVVVQDLLDGQHVRWLGRHGDLLSLILRVRVPCVQVVRRGERSLPAITLLWSIWNKVAGSNLSTYVSPSSSVM